MKSKLKKIIPNLDIKDKYTMIDTDRKKKFCSKTNKMKKVDQDKILKNRGK